MNYINYKKDNLRKLKVSDINIALPELKNVNKAETISQWLMNWIDSVDESNSLLPTKAEFAYSLGVSLGTIQNVFKILEHNNYIYSKQRIGAIIKKTDTLLEVRKQTSKVDLAVEQIKTYFKKVGISKNEKIPSSRNISETLGIPLNTIRFALQKLVSGNIIIKTNDGLVLNNNDFVIQKIISSETLVDKVKHDLKLYIAKNFKVGEKIPPNAILAEKFKVSIKTIHNAIKLLEKEEMLHSRRGFYGTIVISTSMNSLFEPKPETSIFAKAQDTAFYYYQKTQNRIKQIILDNYGIGAKLPSIKEFSASLDLSPNTIRKAIDNLTQEGILHSTRGRYGGTFVINLPTVDEQTFRWLAVNPTYVEMKN